MEYASVGIGAVVFIAVYFGGLHIMNRVEAYTNTKAALRRMRIVNRVRAAEYTGPRFSVRGRELG